MPGHGRQGNHGGEHEGQPGAEGAGVQAVDTNTLSLAQPYRRVIEHLGRMYSTVF